MQLPTMDEVQSSNILEIGYDLHYQTLFIRFKGRADKPGSLYRYIAVPPEVHKQFMAASSFGKFFLARIKGKYAFEKVA